MFSTYKQVILRTYREKVHAGEVSLRLQSPTPAGIKEELLHVLQKGYDSKKDQQTLILFFGHQENLGEYIKAVQRTEIDKFKPVINFLKGSTDNPDDKQVHLAALLINYEHRPYVFGRDYGLGEEEKESLMNTEERENEANKLSGNTQDPAGSSMTKSSKKVSFIRLLRGVKGRDWMFIPVMVVLFGSGSMIAHKLSGEGMDGKQCMYWQEDHYEAVACNTSLGTEIEKIALDTFLLESFKKITLLDTITERSIGKIWYLKHQKQFEYFTAPGKHPLHKKKLSRLSAYIFQRELKSRHK